MSKLHAADRRGLRSSQFAVPSRRAFPIPDKSHARAALSMIRYAHGPAEKAAVRAKAHRVLGH